MLSKYWKNWRGIKQISLNHALIPFFQISSMLEERVELEEHLIGALEFIIYARERLIDPLKDHYTQDELEKIGIAYVERILEEPENYNYEEVVDVVKKSYHLIGWSVWFAQSDKELLGETVARLREDMEWDISFYMRLSTKHAESLAWSDYRAAELFIEESSERLDQLWDYDHFYVATELEYDELLEKIQILAYIEANMPNMN